ncbi:MAG: type I 3-dehydroquinate dehydratase [Desulfobacterales bacterium]
MRLRPEHSVKVRGKEIGGALPLICLPVVANNRIDLISQIEELLPLSPDLLEWRIDGFEDIDPIEKSLQALSDLRTAIGDIPLIVTCRVDLEGGIRTISRDKRLELTAAFIRTGLADIVDIELINDQAFLKTILDAADRHGVKTMLSFHDFEKTPDEAAILDRLIRAQDLGAHIAKAAVMPGTHQDVLILLNTALKARTGALRIPMAAISMGEIGVVTRIAGGLFGSDITFALGRSATAPGQVSIGDLRQAMSVLYR